MQVLGEQVPPSKSQAGRLLEVDQQRSDGHDVLFGDADDVFSQDMELDVASNREDEDDDNKECSASSLHNDQLSESSTPRNSCSDFSDRLVESSPK